MNDPKVSNANAKPNVAPTVLKSGPMPASMKEVENKAVVAGDKMKKLSSFVATMNKKHGPNSVTVGKGDAESMRIPRISTNSPEIDDILGGGFPRGRISELSGPEASGKSTICFTTIAKLQMAGGLVAYVDVEHALDRAYCTKMGMNFDAMVITQPESAEEALSMVEDFVDSGLFDMIVVDSVAALTPKKELEGEMGDQHMGILARLMGQALRKLKFKVAIQNSALVFINQIRMKIGVMHGNPETTPGGNALKFFASVRLDVRRIEAIKVGETVIGQKMAVKTTKCKVAQPYRKVEVSLIYGEGFDQITGVYEEAVAKKVFTKGGGSHYFMGDKTQKFASSRDEMISRLKNEPELLEKIIQENAKIKSGDVATPAEESAE